MKWQHGDRGLCNGLYKQEDQTAVLSHLLNCIRHCSGIWDKSHLTRQMIPTDWMIDWLFISQRVFRQWTTRFCSSIASPGFSYFIRIVTHPLPITNTHTHTPPLLPQPLFFSLISSYAAHNTPHAVSDIYTHLPCRLLRCWHTLTLSSVHSVLGLSQCIHTVPAPNPPYPPCCQTSASQNHYTHTTQRKLRHTHTHTCVCAV